MSTLATSIDDVKLIREKIENHAMEQGFTAIGFCGTQLFPETKDNMIEFLHRGHQGEMSWLASGIDRRTNPKILWSDALTIISVACSYAPESDPLMNLYDCDIGNISVYARGRDYHEVMKKRLKRLGRWISEEFSCSVKVFVDTAPVMEKPLAQKAQLGWQGKHTNLVSREHGSWLFLGEIFINIDLSEETELDDTLKGHCGSCQRCMEICPTKAFPAPYQLDARKCISYLTIEHEGPIDSELRPLMGNRIFGCDDCLAVCPWNKFAQAAADPDLKARQSLKKPNLSELARLNDTTFRKLFSKTSIKRTGRDRFVRNVLIAIGNSKNPKETSTVESLLDDPSPIVRGAAVWALFQLVSIDKFLNCREQRFSKEKGAHVQNEWNLALK